MKFPCVVRLDSSGGQIFELAAKAGEWAVPGSFAFLDSNPADLPCHASLGEP